MKAVVAIDSFKGSMSSVEAGLSAKQGILRVFPSAEVSVFPIADGGEGTVDSLSEGMGGELVCVTVTGPLGEKTEAKYGIINKKTAIMEMSAASGITLVPREKLNPMEATTYGVGEMIKDAIERGIREFIIGIGGSATNDGGVGMLSALGFSFKDKNGKEISLGAKSLGEIEEIDTDGVVSGLSECSFKIACDVSNPLCGERGASAVYGPQKGASAEAVRVLDSALRHYAEKTCKKYPNADPEFPGAGAAGGLGFAFMAYLRGELTPGIDLILGLIKLEEAIKTADIVITGEGRLDGQTAMGKAPVGIATLAKKHGKTVFAFAGGVTKDAALCNERGIDAFFPIVRGVCSLDEAINCENAKGNMADSVEQVMRVLKAGAYQ